MSIGNCAPRAFDSFDFHRLSRQILIVAAICVAALAFSAAATWGIVHLSAAPTSRIVQAPAPRRLLPALPTMAPEPAAPANSVLAQLDPGLSPQPPAFSIAPDAPAQDALPAKPSPLAAPLPPSKLSLSPLPEVAPLPPPRPVPFASPVGSLDRWTAVYDLTAHTVTMPDGTKLEAHSGLGDLLDDPSHVDERDRGATPPHLYELTAREELFHGVQALRLNPVGGGGIFGRDGLLAHPYMLGPNGDSNGCVSFKNYDAFLQAFQNGVVKRLVVVASRG